MSPPEITSFPETGGSFTRDPATGKLTRQTEVGEHTEALSAPETAADLAPATQPAPSVRRSTSKGGL